MSELIHIEQNTDGLAKQADMDAANRALEQAESLAVTDQDSADEAGAFLKKCSAAEKVLDARRKEITKPLDAAKKSVMDLFRAPLDTIGQARATVKAKLTEYVTEQERIAREIRRAAEEKARREAEKAAERAQAYEEQGREDMAEKWREREAQAEVAPVGTVQSAPKVAGVAMRTTYEVQVNDLPALLHAVADNQVPETVVQVMPGQLNKFAGQFKGKVNIPGCTIREKKVAAG